jgi:hypothetical protein
MRRILAACLASLVIATLPARAAKPAAAPPVAACPDGAVAGRVFPMSIGGNRAGYHRECRLADGAGLYLFAFNDRGRGPSVRSRIVQDPAGIPAPEVLRMATLGAARAAGQGERLGSIVPGKLADFILVDGDPSADPGALRNLRLVVKDGVPLEPDAMWRELGILPLPANDAAPR